MVLNLKGDCLAKRLSTVTSSEVQELHLEGEIAHPTNCHCMKMHMLTRKICLQANKKVFLIVGNGKVLIANGKVLW